MNEQKLRDLREYFLEIQQTLLTTDADTISLPLGHGGTLTVRLCDLIALACKARFDEEMRDTVTFGEWTTVGKSFHYRPLEGENGHRFVIVPPSIHEAHERQGLARCVSLDGRQSHRQTVDYPHSLRVREIHLPPPRPVPIPKTLDEQAWVLLERVSCVLGGRDYADAHRLLSERARG